MRLPQDPGTRASPVREEAEFVAASLSSKKGPNPDGFAGGSATRRKSETGAAGPSGEPECRELLPAPRGSRHPGTSADPTGHFLPEHRRKDSKRCVSKLGLVVCKTYNAATPRWGCRRRSLTFTWRPVWFPRFNTFARHLSGSEKASDPLQRQFLILKRRLLANYFLSIFCWLCYYSFPNFFSLYPPSTLPPSLQHSPPPA